MKKQFTVGLFLGFAVLLSACGKHITQDEAKKIALKDAGVKESEITMVYESQSDDSFEFEFHNDKNTYKYEIDDDGTIEEKGVKLYQASNNQTTEPTNEQVLSEEDAYAKALAYFEVSKEQVTNYKVQKEMDDGQEVYDVEFLANNKEYSCEIAVTDGSIVSSDIDHN